MDKGALSFLDILGSLLDNIIGFFISIIDAIFG